MVGYLSRRILPEVGVRARTCGEGLCVSYAGLHGIVKFTGVMEEVDRIRGFRAILVALDNVREVQRELSDWRRREEMHGELKWEKVRDDADRSRPLACLFSDV